MGNAIGADAFGATLVNVKGEMLLRQPTSRFGKLDKTGEALVVVYRKGNK